MADEETSELVMAVLDAVSHLSLEDRLTGIEIAWIALAHRARSEALAYPGGFPDEQARQLGHLEKLGLLVAGDAPDLELERLQRQGDLEGALKHLLQRLDDLDQGDESSA
jgi:hypothetical protein